MPSPGLQGSPQLVPLPLAPHPVRSPHSDINVSRIPATLQFLLAFLEFLSSSVCLSARGLRIQLSGPSFGDIL